MASWGAWLAIIGGVVAVVAQWVPDAWLALIGGVVAVIGGIGCLASK